MLKKTLSVMAAACLVAGSSAAVAQSAQPLSLDNAPAAQRAGAQGEDASELRRGRFPWFLGAIAIALLVWGAFELFDDDPESP